MRWPKYWSFISLPLGLALGSPIFPSGCEGKLGVALASAGEPVPEQGALPQRRVVWMWFGAFPGAFGLGRAQPQILWHSAFFIVQLSHPYMTTGKTIALTRRTFVGKVMYPLATRMET